MNPTLELIAKRRSIRAYDGKPLTQEEKDTILQATLRAPTAGNMMLYSIIEVEDQTLKERLAITCDHQSFIAKAPYVLLFLADYQRWMDYYTHCKAFERCHELGVASRKPQEGDLLLACSDALIAAQTAVLAAESMGIGSCYIGDIMESCDIHREMFNLSTYTFPIALICFGYPAGNPSSKKLTPRYGREFIVHTNRYRRLSEEEMEQMVQPQIERYFSDGGFLKGTQNMGQHFYFKKFISDYALELNRSVREILKNWAE